MPKFIVDTEEIVRGVYEIEADDRVEAIRLMKDLSYISTAPREKLSRTRYETYGVVILDIRPGYSDAR